MAEAVGYNRNSINVDLSVDLSPSRQVRQMTADPMGSHPTQIIQKSSSKTTAFYGGSGGIRTHDTLPYT